MKTADDHHACLRNLRREFATFRRRYPPHTRVPGQLRRAVLEAVRSGIDPALLKGELGVTGAQVAKWRQCPSPTQEIAFGAGPRVLEVVPSGTGTGAVRANGLRVSYEAGRLLLELSL